MKVLLKVVLCAALLVTASVSQMGVASSQNLPAKKCEQMSPREEWKAIVTLLQRLRYTPAQIKFGESATKITTSALSKAALNAKGRECGLQTVVAMSISCIGVVLPDLVASIPSKEADEMVTIDGAEKLAGRNTMTRREAALIGAVGICFGQARELLTDS